MQLNRIKGDCYRILHNTGLRLIKTNLNPIGAKFSNKITLYVLKTGSHKVAFEAVTILKIYQLLRPNAVCVTELIIC